jgi:hypothetical protein
MKFELFDRRHLGASDLILVDCNVPGFQGLNLDHHYGQATPAELRHELATGVVLRFVDGIHRCSPSRFRSVAIDHYDTDGVLSVFALLRPGLALEHERKLLSAAVAGDFLEYDDHSGAAISLAIQDDIMYRCLEQPKEKRLRWCFEEALALLPELLEHPDRLADRWEPRLEEFLDERELLRSQSLIEERREEGISVIRSSRPFSDFALAATAELPLIVSVVSDSSTRADYDAWVRMRLSWGYEPVDVPDLPIDLNAAALRLQVMERRAEGDALWCCEEYESIGWRVRATSSRLPEEVVLNEIGRCAREPASPRQRRRDPSLPHRARRFARRLWASHRPVVRHG